jgi:hypothetical protein
MRRLVAFTSVVLTMVAIACGGGDDPTAPTSNDPGKAPAKLPSFDYAEHPDGMWINTDKNDYAPGDRVIFTGGGWQPGDTLNIHLVNDSTHAEQDWTILIDQAGAFTDSTYLVGEADLNLSFTLTATSRANPAQTLTVRFTDGTLSLSAPTVPPSFQSFPYSSGNLTFTAANSANPATAHTNVAIRIRGPGNLNPTAPTLHRQLTVTASLAAGSSASVVWDGLNSSASQLAEGLYGVRVFSTQRSEPNGEDLRLLVDRTAPNISSSPAPNLSPNQATPGLPGTQVIFTATAADPVVSGINANNYRVASAEYRIDNGGWLAMTAVDGQFNDATEATTATIPAGTVAALTSGTHLVCIRATDGAGNRSADNLANNTNCATLTIAAADNVAPTVTNVQASPNPGKTGNATLTATAADALSNIKSAEYNVDGGGWNAMSAQDGSFNAKSEVVTANLTGVAEGSHQVCVRASDVANNTSDGTACITLVVDKTPPSVANVAAIPNPGKTGNATLTATATDVLTNITGAEYRIDAGNWTPMAAQDGAFDSKSDALTASLTGLAEGSYTVCVRATDQVTNTSPGTGTACITLIVDKTPPVVSSVQASPNPANGTAAVVLTATATDALTNVTSAEYKIDNGGFGAMAASDGSLDELAEDVTVTIPATTIAALSDGNHSLCVRATDAATNTSGDDAACTTLLVDKTPPVVTSVQASPNPTQGNAAVVLSATATDALTKVTSAEYNIDGGSFSAMGASDGAFDELAEDVTVTIPATTISGLSEGSHTLCIRATDNVSNTSSDTGACTTLVVDKTPPAITAFTVTPNPVAVNTPFVINASFKDDLTKVSSAEYSLTGAAGPWYALPNAGGSYDTDTESGSKSVTLANPDVLDVCVRSTDQVGNTNQGPPDINNQYRIQCIFLAVYDPTAGFVTGGGWINSPAGAYQADLTLTGKATFGFVSKYQKGASVPVGNTEFQFHAGNMNFSSTTYDWLVVSQNGVRAQYKGYGTVNGQSGYGFLLTALDQTSDQFRIKIWNTATSAIVYDNRLGSADSSNDATPLGGGSIMIHVPKK